jgi:hypothetical protein
VYKSLEVGVAAAFQSMSTDNKNTQKKEDVQVILARLDSVRSKGSFKKRDMGSFMLGDLLEAASSPNG